MDSNRDTVRDLIGKLLSTRDEGEQSVIAQELDEICPDPEWSDHIFHSTDYYNEDDTLNVEAVVEKIFSYQPIIL
ncbi:hypothetical protein [Ruegeria sp. ANG-R]|uniref:hypothetical protein n=1 Tax=Ruegeria sp. ANG-R TaxID=1577903 RepID=UPI001269C60B|nr:hypothetical protein [Ruegeria sp. ANG-R]